MYFAPRKKIDIMSTFKLGDRVLITKPNHDPDQHWYGGMDWFHGTVQVIDAECYRPQGGSASFTMAGFPSDSFYEKWLTLETPAEEERPPVLKLSSAGKCPICGSPGIIGAYHFACPNLNCQNYKG